MQGLLINSNEAKEIEYLLKREMEEILLDMADDRIENVVKEKLTERYGTLFQLFRRIAPPHDCLNYILKKQ